MIKKSELFKVSKFRKKMYSYFTSHRRTEVIHNFKKLLRKVPKNMNEDDFRQWFMEQLQIKLDLTKKQSSELYGQIRNSSWEKYKKKRKWSGSGQTATLGIGKFKFVSNPKPFQGGSPGLGKKK